jgi:hypothetical protein
MSIGRHERVRGSAVLPALGWLCALAAAVLAAVNADPRYLRLAVVLALVAVVPHALAAARSPSRGELRTLRREVAGMRSELAVRAAPIIEIVIVPTTGPPLGTPVPANGQLSVNGAAHVDKEDSRRVVLDLVALEEMADGRG